VGLEVVSQEGIGKGSRMGTGPRRTVALMALAVSAGCFGIVNEPYMAAADPAAQPTPGKVTVNFHRTAGSVETKFPVWDRDSFVGFSTPTTTIVYECDPGEHLFVVQAESPVLVKATLAADKTYDILIEGQMGMRQARATATPITLNHRMRPHLGLYDRIPKVKSNPASAAQYEAADKPAVQQYLQGLEPRLDSMNIAKLVEEDGR
jgi:hypothetical protein